MHPLAEPSSLIAPASCEGGAGNQGGRYAEAISSEFVRAATRRFGDSLRAIVLTGSLARNEGTDARKGDGCRMLGDAEFFLVFSDAADQPAPALITTLRAEVQKGLAARGIQCAVGVSAVHAAYFRNLKPHVFAFELRECGHVLWGDASILGLIPPFTANEIPREDAWRMIANRLIEWLELRGAEEEDEPESPSREEYRRIKLLLDLATSYLVFSGAYATGYLKRAERLEWLADGGVPDEKTAPFSLPAFAALVRQATDSKVCGATVPDSLATAHVLSYVRALWVWELRELTGIQEPAVAQDLMKAWMRRQPLSARLRSWAFVARRCGWLRSWRNWPRWTRMALAGSPRYWVYAAAADLSFLLPLGAGEPQPPIRVERLRDSLPIPRPQADKADDCWRTVAAALVWNYREFLEPTRS